MFKTGDIVYLNGDYSIEYCIYQEYTDAHVFLLIRDSE